MDFKFGGVFRKAKEKITGSTIESPQDLARFLAAEKAELESKINSLPVKFREKFCRDIEFSDQPNPIFAAQGLGGGKPLPQEIEAEMVLTLRSIIKTIEEYLQGLTKPQSARVAQVYGVFNSEFRSSQVKDLGRILGEFITDINSL